MNKILIVDDEVKIRETMKKYLEDRGFVITLAKDGKEALELAFGNTFNLIILDVMMPKMNGIDVCREIRKKLDTPVLFLSALGEEQDLLKGYQVGADDYIVKPFSLAVLAQKCSAMIRRNTGADMENKVTASGIVLDMDRKKIYIEDLEIILQNKDFGILAYLIEKKGIVLSRKMILTRIWGYNFIGDERVVDTHIKRIRKALGEKAECIVTVVGSGYVFQEEKNE